MSGDVLTETGMRQEWPWALNPGLGGQTERGQRAFAHVLPFAGFWPAALGRAVALLALAALALGPAGAAAAQEPVPPIQQEPVPPIQPDRPGIADGSTVVGPAVFQAEVGVQRQTFPAPGGGAS